MNPLRNLGLLDNDGTGKEEGRERAREGKRTEEQTEREINAYMVMLYIFSLLISFRFFSLRLFFLTFIRIFFLRITHIIYTPCSISTVKIYCIPHVLFISAKLADKQEAALTVHQKTLRERCFISFS